MTRLHETSIRACAFGVGGAGGWGESRASSTDDCGIVAGGGVATIEQRGVMRESRGGVAGQVRGDCTAAFVSSVQRCTV